MHPRTASEIVAIQFTACVKRAAARELPAIELITAAEEMTNRGEGALVGHLYKLWIEHNPNDPLLHAILFNYGALLSAAGELPPARAAFAEAIRLRPDFLPPYINLGTLLERQGDVQQAVACWLHVANHLIAVNAETVFHRTTALKQIGRVLEAGRDAKGAEDALQKCLDLNPYQRDALQHWISLRQVQCKWPVIVPWGNVTRTLLMQAISPLSLAIYTDDPLFQLANSHRYYRHDVAPPTEPGTVGNWAPPLLPQPVRLKIGYVSSDLREHAVGFLTREIFELHDPAKVETFAYYCGPNLTDATQDRIKRAVGHWIDISALTDKQAARQIIADEIDILIDLNGYTKDGRTKLFALRPAPIIVNWLGFPGSTGSPHHHYIIGDETVIPPGSEKYYSEKVLRLPCYQPNDRKRAVAEHILSRADAGLPDAAFVYCCFNGAQKITRFTFQRWMAILRAVPHAVLWLLSSGEASDERLRLLTAEHGIEPARLVFSPWMANAHHLARYKLADLFLDTSPYGAHTTASDALWMGVPVLTVAGRGFAARVCASLVHGAGLAELICSDGNAYVTRAIALAGDPAALDALRDRLLANRDHCALFDTPDLVRRLEGLYEQMWADYTHGSLPRPDLANLEIYHEIGCTLEHEAAEPQGASDYEQTYRTALAYRDALSPLRPDGRFWRDPKAACAAAPSIKVSARHI